MTMQLDEEHLKSSQRAEDRSTEEKKHHQVHILRIFPVVLFTSLQSNRQRANNMQFFASTMNKLLEGRKTTLSLSQITEMCLLRIASFSGFMPSSL